MALLICDNLSLGYDGRTILTELSFSLESSSYLCIVGENGSGKSTLVKTILGLNSPLRGSVTFGDGLNRNEIGYLPQQTNVQRDFPASVREIVLSGYQAASGLRPYYNSEEKKQAEAALEKMDALHLAKRSYMELSGGQQQRVLLARALCATRKLLVLDEPVAGLDPIATAEMYNLIEKLNTETGLTIIMVSHDINAALKYASHILHIGNTNFFGTKDEYLKSAPGKIFSAEKTEAAK